MLDAIICVVWSYDFFAASCLLLLFDSSVEAPASNFRGFRSPCGVYLLHSAEAKMRLLVTSSVLTYGLHTLSHFLIASSASTVNSHNELSWLRLLQYSFCYITSLYHPVTVSVIASLYHCMRLGLGACSHSSNTLGLRRKDFITYDGISRTLTYLVTSLV